MSDQSQWSGAPSSSTNQRAFPDADATEARVTPASFGVRFGARVIDTIVGLCLGFVLGLPIGILLAILAQLGVIEPSWPVKIKAFSAASFALSMLGTVVYHSLSESIGGATIGKWICGLRVGTADFSPDQSSLVAFRPCTFGGAFIRSLAILVDGLFLCAVAYMTMSGSPWQQRLGDKWGNTLVVHAKSLEKPGKSPALGVFLGLLAWSVFVTLAMLVKVL